MDNSQASSPQPSLPLVAARPPVDNGKPLPTGLLAATRHSKNDRRYLASAVFNVPPAALPGATRRREARGAGVAGCALRPCPPLAQAVRCGSASRGRVLALRAAGRTNPLTLPLRWNLTRSAQSRPIWRFLSGSHTDLLPATKTRRDPLRLFLVEPVVKVGMAQPSQPCRLTDNERSEASASSPCHSLNDE